MAVNRRAIIHQGIQNIKYEGSTSEMIYKTDLLIKWLLELVKKDVDRTYEGMHNKLIRWDFLNKGVEASRIKKVEEKELKIFFKEKKYNWKECREKITKVIVLRKKNRKI